MKKLILLPFLFIALFLVQTASAEDFQNLPSPFYCLGTSCVPSISPSVPPSIPSPSIFTSSPSISSSVSLSPHPSGETATPSASPEVNPSPSSSPSGTPSNPKGPVCTSFSQFINNLTTTQSTTDSKVHAKCAPSGGGKGGDGNGGGNNGVNPNNGWLSKFFALLIEILLQLFQLCGVQPINGTPVPSGTPLPSLSLSLPPSGVVPSKAAQPSQSQNQPSQSQNQPSQSQNQPSQSQNQPSQSQNQPSQSQNQPSQSQNQPSNQPSQAAANWGYAKPNNISATSSPTQTGCNISGPNSPYCTSFKVTVSWTPPTTTATGATLSSVGASAPKNYIVEIDYNIVSTNPTNYKSVINKTATSPYTVTLPNVTYPYSSITVKITPNGAPGTSQTASISIAPGKSNASWAFAAPTALTETTDPNGSKASTTSQLPWDILVTWASVTKTTTGTAETPSGYNIAFYQSNGTVIGGITNTSSVAVGKLTPANCSPNCKQTFTAPASAIAALAASGSYVKVSAAGGTNSSTTKTNMNPWTFQAPPNLKELSSESVTGTTGTWTMKVTWGVPKALEGGGTKTFAVTPASYGIQFFDGSNKAISGISTQGAASCTSTSCTQIFSVTNSSTGKTAAVALSSKKAYVELAPKGAPISPASSDAKYTITDVTDYKCTDYTNYACIKPGAITNNTTTINGKQYKVTSHLGGTYDTTCSANLTTLCYQVTAVTSSAAAGPGSVFSDAVDAAASVWNAITTPIVHVLTSL